MTRIVVFSDIHFGKFSRTTEFAVPGEEIRDKSIGGFSLEQGLIEVLKEMKPQYILLAGDLTSIASPQEFVFCEKKILSIASTIGIDKNNIICCMGNHDIDWKIAELYNQHVSDDDRTIECSKDRYQRIAAGSSRFCLESIKEAEAEKRGPAPYNGIFEAEDFIIVTLNSGWRCGKNQGYSHGEITKEQLDWFENTLREYNKDDRKKLVLLHHHPFNYPYPVIGEDISQITEGAEFTEIVENYNVDLVIHGHRHHPKTKTIMKSGRRPITYFCAGSLAVNADHRYGGDIPNTVHFIDVDKNLEYFWLYNYSYTAAEGWKDTKNCKVTPLDHKMKVGKIFDIKTIKDAVNEYRDEAWVILEWEKLDECLQFMPCNKLTELFKNELKSTHCVIGSFPEQVCLYKIKEE